MPVAVSRQLDADVQRVIALFRRDETPEFIATEFMMATGLRQAVRRGGKLDRSLQQVEKLIAKDGFEWWSAPFAVRQIVDTVRDKLQSAPYAEARAVILSLLQDDDPQIIREVRVE